MKKYWRLGLPLAVLLLLAAVLARGLQFDPKNLPSARQGKPAPEFSLPSLNPSALAVASNDMKGQAWVLNVFASWCGACIVEHPRLMKLVEDKRVQLVGLAYKDNPVDTQRWLAKHGNPYSQIAVDLKGNVGIDYGVYGVPETYVIDAGGVIRSRHTGPITDDFIDRQIMPLLSKAAPK